jgi:hypothetical protein
MTSSHHENTPFPTARKTRLSGNGAQQQTIDVIAIKHIISFLKGQGLE